jgi:raffinose/stachyose/melibiose transport system substrate-binding protein
MQFQAKRSTKRWLVGAALAAGLIGASGLGAVPQSARAATVNLTFLTWYASPAATAFNGAIKDFEKSHPGITITQNTVAGTGAATFPNQLRTDIAGGSAPDLFTMWGGTLSGPFIDAHSALDLTPYYKKYHWNQIFLPAAVKLIMRHGTVWGAPIDLRAIAFYYRKDIFSKYGLHVPTTFTQLEGVCGTLKAHAIPCMATGGIYGWHIMRVFDFFLEHTAGPALHDQLLAGKTSWNRPQVVAAFALLKKWTANGWFPSSYMGVSPTQAEQLFEQGKAAMLPEGDWMVPTLNAAGLSANQYGFFAPPTDQKPARLDGFAEQFMIASQSKHPTEAAEFLNWWLQPATQRKYYAVNGSSASIGALPSATVNPLGNLYAKLFSTRPTYTIMDQAFPAEFMSTTFFRLQSGVASGQVPPQSAAQQMQQGVSQIQP